MQDLPRPGIQLVSPALAGEFFTIEPPRKSCSYHSYRNVLIRENKSLQINELTRGEKEKAMAPHSRTLAWRIPGTEEPGRLQSMGSLTWTRLSDFTFTFHFHALEKEMATHSSALAWRIPGTGDPGGLPSMGSHRVGHD